jgi:hypothetical protein
LCPWFLTNFWKFHSFRVADKPLGTAVADFPEAGSTEFGHSDFSDSHFKLVPGTPLYLPLGVFCAASISICITSLLWATDFPNHLPWHSGLDLYLRGQNENPSHPNTKRTVFKNEFEAAKTNQAGRPRARGQRETPIGRRNMRTFAEQTEALGRYRGAKVSRRWLSNMSMFTKVGKLSLDK